MDIIMNIILGTIGSIVATAILFLASILYKNGYKDEIRFNLTAARTAIYQIQNQHLFPEDYALVISQIDILHRCAFCIFRNLYPLSLLRDRNAKICIFVVYSY